MLQPNKSGLKEYEIHQILSNPRRRATIRQLSTTPGRISLRDLSEAVAAAETGVTPAPRRVRESVYNALHQTHLPKLQELGVVRYHRDAREVELLEPARQVGKYMDIVTRHGVTWGEYYRGLGILGLFSVVAALSGVPLFSALDPLLWASGFLAVYAMSTAYQLWVNRWNVLRSLSGTD